MANPHERGAMAAVVHHLSAAADADATKAGDLQSAADALTRAYDLGGVATPAADAPTFLAVYEAGAAALGVAAVSAAAGAAAAAATPTSGARSAAPSAPTFDKFLRTLKKTKFFDGVAEGTPDFDARVATARAKFDSKYGAGAAAGGTAAAAPATAAPPPAAPAAAAATPAPADANGGADGAPTAEDVAAAEALKASGNDALLRKDYAEAERLYTAALARRPRTAVYLSNRAAAKIYQASYVDALDDCKAAIEVEPGFVRAHERLASAYRHLGMAEEEVQALQDAAALDPRSTKIASALAAASARAAGEAPAGAGASSVGTRSATAAGAGAGTGGGGGMPGGMPPGMPPGLEGLMNNPAVRSMAENFASSGGLQAMMNNPSAMANMMGALGGGGGGGAPRAPGAGPPPPAGGMPDLGALLSNPALAGMLGGMGGGGRGAGGGGAPGAAPGAGGGGGGGGGGAGGAPPNPMAAIQQAMADPEAMAQMMSMAQNFLGGAGRGGGAPPPQ